LLVGPNYGGCRPFDRDCIFGNNMELDKEQCKWLNWICKNCPGEKHYVYKMTPSAANKKKGKMVRIIMDQSDSIFITND
jgi:hypothetical protein